MVHDGDRLFARDVRHTDRAAGKAVLVTSIRFLPNVVPSVPSTSDYVKLQMSPDGTCSTSTLGDVVELQYITGRFPTESTYDLPGGLPVRAGSALCVYGNDFSNLSVNIAAYGYTVAANAVP